MKLSPARQPAGIGRDVHFAARQAALDAFPRADGHRAGAGRRPTPAAGSGVHADGRPARGAAAGCPRPGDGTRQPVVSRATQSRHETPRRRTGVGRRRTGSAVGGFDSAVASGDLAVDRARGRVQRSAAPAGPCARPPRRRDCGDRTTAVPPATALSGPSADTPRSTPHRPAPASAVEDPAPGWPADRSARAASDDVIVVRQVDVLNGHVHPEHSGRERRRQVVHDHRVQAGDLLNLVVAVDCCLRDQRVDLGPPQDPCGHEPRPWRR